MTPEPIHLPKWFTWIVSAQLTALVGISAFTTTLSVQVARLETKVDRVSRIEENLDKLNMGVTMLNAHIEENKRRIDRVETR